MSLTEDTQSSAVEPDRTAQELAEARRIVAEEAHREIAAKLEQQARVFDTMLSSITDFVYVFDRDGRFVYVNKALLDLWGLNLADAVGRNFFELKYPEELAAKLQSQIQQVIQTRQRLSDETAYTSPAGATGYYEYIFSPVFAADGTIELVAGTTRDITERKRVEEALRVSEIKYRHATEVAETANRDKDRFLAVLSHELRTPLSPVVMALPAIELDPELPPKFREDLAMVRRNIDLEVKLIDDLLDLSRITSGKLRLHMQPIRLHEVLRHAIRNSASDISGKQLAIGEEFGANDDLLTGDPARLQQVFWNLIRNAVKFTSDSGRITIRTWNSTSNQQLFVEVEDSGVGIPADLLPRIFDAFEQGDARMTRQYGGLGLGLAIAKAVVDMHGGAISARSPGRGCGATFTVQLTCLAENRTPQESTPDDSPAFQTRGSRAKILLVEDHPDTTRMLARLLSASGFNVKTAHSMASALQVAELEPFDVLISDIGLPDASGYELMQQMRSRRNLKGIALSGYGMEDDIRKSREAGFVEHVTKPVNVDQLILIIDRVTDAGQSLLTKA